MEDRAKSGMFAPAALIRQMVVAAVGLGLLAMMLMRLGSPDLTASVTALLNLPMWRWGVALGGAAGSYLAFGLFDAGVHRLAGSGIPPRLAVRAGMVSGACSQTIGFGPVTGALARWRLLQGIDLAGAARISLLSSVAFLTVWAVLAALIAAGSPLIAPMVPIPLRLGVAAAAASAL